MTGKLEVRYRSPAPIEQRLTIRGWLTGDSCASKIEKTGANVMESTLELALKGKKEREGTDWKPWEIDLELGQVKTAKVDTGILSVELEKSKRLGKLALARRDCPRGRRRRPAGTPSRP